MESLIKTIHKHAPTSEILGAASFQLARYLELLVHMGHNDFQKAATLEAETEKRLNQYSGKLNKSYEIAIDINLALSLWIIEDPLKSLKWITKITKVKNSDARPDLQSFAYMFYAMLLANAQNEAELSRLETLILKDRLPIALLPFDQMAIKFIIKWTVMEKEKKNVHLHKLLAEANKPEYAGQVGVDIINVWGRNKLEHISLIVLAVSA